MKDKALGLFNRNKSLFYFIGVLIVVWVILAGIVFVKTRPHTYYGTTYVGTSYDYDESTTYTAVSTNKRHAIQISELKDDDNTWFRRVDGINLKPDGKYYKGEGWESVFLVYASKQNMRDNKPFKYQYFQGKAQDVLHVSLRWEDHQHYRFLFGPGSNLTDMPLRSDKVSSGTKYSYKSIGKVRNVQQYVKEANAFGAKRIPTSRSID